MCGAYFHVIKQNAPRLAHSLSPSLSTTGTHSNSFGPTLSLSHSLSALQHNFHTQHVCNAFFLCFLFPQNNLYFTKVAPAPRSLFQPAFLSLSLPCCFDSPTKLKLSSWPSSLHKQNPFFHEKYQKKESKKYQKNICMYIHRLKVFFLVALDLFDSFAHVFGQASTQTPDESDLKVRVCVGVCV